MRHVRNRQSAGRGIYNSGWNDGAPDSAVWPCALAVHRPLEF